MEPELRLGVIGAGTWGRRIITTIRQIEGIRLARLASRNPESKGWVPADCPITSDWRVVASARDLDGIVVASPTPWHGAMALSALQTRMPVLVEKPLTLSVSRAMALQRACVRYRSLLMVGHIHVFSPAYQALKRLAPTKGTIRAICSVGGNYGPFRPDTPALWDYGAHDLSMCLDLLGQEPMKVACRHLAQVEASLGKGTVSEISLEFPSGVTVQLVVGNAMPEKTRRFEVEFQDGKLVYDDLAQYKLAWKSDSGQVENLELDGTLPLKCELLAFCESIRTGRNYDSSLDTAVAVTKILERCQSLTDSP